MSAIFPPPLLAADVWEVVIAIVFFVLYGIGQLVSAREQAKKKPPRRQPPRQPVGEPPVAEVAGPPRNQEEALRREVDDFLRRAQGKPVRQEEPARLSPPPHRRQQSDRPTAERDRPAPRRREPLTPSPTTSPATDLRSESVAEHVTKHIHSQKLTKHAERLGDELTMADENRDARLHAKFDHQLGSLKHDKVVATAIERPNFAAELAELMRKPGGMQQLIVAQEILRRPER